jgi:type II secretory pathway component PulC
MSIVLRLAVIALLVYAGVTYWYDRVEERLQVQKPPEKNEQMDTPVKEKGRPASAEDDYRVILTRNIFQAGSESGDQPQTKVEDLAETKLHLALLGTVTGGRDDARAIIRDELSKLEDLYQTGSEVQGAIISRISRGRVVLQVNGREEVLTIRDPANDDQGRGGAVRMESRVQERAPEIPGREIENKVPEAQPRRRISFRNTGTSPPAVESPVRLAPEEGQAETAERQPLPNDETPPSDPGMEKTTEGQQGQ